MDHPASEGRFFEEAVQDGRGIGGGVEAHRRVPRVASEQMFGIAAVYAHPPALV